MHLATGHTTTLVQNRRHALRNSPNTALSHCSLRESDMSPHVQGFAVGANVNDVHAAKERARLLIISYGVTYEGIARTAAPFTPALTSALGRDRNNSAGSVTRGAHISHNTTSTCAHTCRCSDPRSSSSDVPNTHRSQHDFIFHPARKTSAVAQQWPQQSVQLRTSFWSDTSQEQRQGQEHGEERPAFTNSRRSDHASHRQTPVARSTAHRVWEVSLLDTDFSPSDTPTVQAMKEAGDVIKKLTFTCTQP